MKRARAWGLAPLMLMAGAAPIQATSLDEVALRQNEMRQDVRAVEDRLSRLEAMLNNQGLLNLLNEINQLKAEVARLRGTQEEQAHALAQSDRRQKELYADLDARLKEVAARSVAPPPKDAVRLQPATTLQATPADPQAENRAYEAALGHFRAADYRTAVGAFEDFLRQHPDAGLASNAYYWMGLAHATLGDYAAAVQAYRKLLADYPASGKAPDAMVSLARAQIQLGEPASAQDLLEQVIAKHPASRAAENARKLLATLK